jgi:hypothetical protein
MKNSLLSSDHIHSLLQMVEHEMQINKLKMATKNLHKLKADGVLHDHAEIYYVWPHQM